MTVQELKTSLKRYGFDDADPLMVWINAAMHEIESAYEKWSFLWFEEEKETAEKRFEITTAVNRLSKVRDITNEGVSGGVGYDLTYLDLRAFEREFGNLNSPGDPEYFTILGSSKIQVYPAPAGNRKYRVTGIKELSDLVEDGEEPDIPTKNHYTIVRGAAYIALQAENEEERAASAQAQFESDLDKMVTNDSIRQIGEPTFVEDTADYAN